MRVALLADEHWETTSRLLEVLPRSGIEVRLNPDWSDLPGCSIGVVRSDYWARGKELTLSKALVLERYGKPFLNSMRSLLLADDKAASGVVLRAAGVATPETWTVDPTTSCPELTTPLIVKPLKDSQSRGIEVFQTASEADRYIARCSRQQLVQPFIVGTTWRVVATATRAVRTYRVGVDERGITGLKPGERRPVVQEPRLELEEAAVAAVRALGGDLMGVDVIEDMARQLWVLEANPGFGFNSGDDAVEDVIVEELRRLCA
jgi:glutathione synthase/RimK-type ligase-like ATP-grasp enzyme